MISCLGTALTCLPHVWCNTDIIKGPRRRQLDRRWTPQTTLPTHLSTSHQLNRHSIITTRNIPFCFRFLFDAGRRGKSECPRCQFPNNTRASVCDRSSRRRTGPFPSFPYALSFLVWNPSLFLVTVPLHADSTFKIFYWKKCDLRN